MIGIYKITNPKEKKYIGQSIHIEKRWKQYQVLCSSSIGPKLYNSLVKYGLENHIFEIIEECLAEQLNEREIFWKQYYNSINEGLNCELFDKGGGPRSKETKDKMSKSHKINLSRPEIIEKRKINCKISANKLGVQAKAIANTNWELRNINLRKTLGRKIIQCELNENFIKNWDSSMCIQRFYKDKKFWSTEIIRCCRGHRESAYGFIWKYLLK